MDKTLANVTLFAKSTNFFSHQIFPTYSIYFYKQACYKAIPAMLSSSLCVHPCSILLCVCCSWEYHISHIGTIIAMVTLINNHTVFWQLIPWDLIGVLCITWYLQLHYCINTLTAPRRYKSLMLLSCGILGLYPISSAATWLAT